MGWAKQNHEPPTPTPCPGSLAASGSRSQTGRCPRKPLHSHSKVSSAINLSLLSSSKYARVMQQVYACIFELFTNISCLPGKPGKPVSPLPEASFCAELTVIALPVDTHTDHVHGIRLCGCHDGLCQRHPWLPQESRWSRQSARVRVRVRACTIHDMPFVSLVWRTRCIF